MQSQTDLDTSADAQNSAALHTTLAALEASGADRFDPVRFRYIQTMANRSRQQDANVATVLVDKAWQALQAYQASFSKQRIEVEPLLRQIATEHPTMAEQLQSQFDAGEFTAIRRLAAQRRKPDISDAFAALTHQLQSTAPDDNDFAESNAQELKAVRYFRDALQKEHADKLVTRAQIDAPESAGPLNPQKLALRSLAIMRDISPAYLGHFVSYVDALFWLEQFADARASK